MSSTARRARSGSRRKTDCTCRRRFSICSWAIDLRLLRRQVEGDDSPAEPRVARLFEARLFQEAHQNFRNREPLDGFGEIAIGLFSREKTSYGGKKPVQVDPVG